MKKLLLLLLIVLFASCSDSPTEPKSNPYSGAWRIVFAGSYIGSGNLTIDSEGKFSLIVALKNSDNTTFTNTITGSVSSSGSMKADTYYNGAKIGTVTGTFVGDSASGSYQTIQPTYGTWSATKK
ncbi:MAG: hypothetical protein COW71_07500 [Ignavibacteriales bacterium CG18_big_fil_WC_8_21_14_2_50_31_20]|nr:MAG: hypothetical protein COW71_07500 [Ignavibacteriales bacterium CG18_big_fil_WC_8_21_14_2_50_31_20]